MSVVLCTMYAAGRDQTSPVLLPLTTIAINKRFTGLCIRITTTVTIERLTASVRSWPRVASPPLH